MNSKEANGTGRTERKKAKTKQTIINTAIKLFHEQGFDATTMEQIAIEVDIAKGTLYNYFPVKEAIIYEYVRQSFKEKHCGRILRIRQAPDTRSRMILILNELITEVQVKQEIFEKFLIYQVQNMISLRRNVNAQSGFTDLAAEIIRLGQASSEIRDDLPLNILIALFEFLFIEVAQQFYTEPKTFNARETIEQYVDLCLNGLKPGYQSNEEK